MILLAQLLFIAAPASALAWVLRRAGVPGGAPSAGLVAGLFIGLVAGAGVAGRAWPQWHQRVVVGDAAQARALGELRQRHVGELAALRAAGVTPVAIQEHLTLQAQEVAPLRAAARDAAQNHRARLDDLALAILAAHVLMLMPTIVPRRARHWSRTLAAVARTSGRAPLAGLAAVAIGAVPPAIVAHVVLGASPVGALGLGLAMSLPGLALSLRPAPYVAAAAGLVGGALAIVALAWTIALSLVVVAAALGLMIALGREGGVSRRARRTLSTAALLVTLPACVALLTVRLDLAELWAAHANAMAWGLVVALLWSGDGRWTAWWIAWRLIEPQGTRARRWTISTGPVNCGAGLAQAGTVLALAAAGQIDDALIAVGLAGALAVELLSGARSWLAPLMDAPPAPPEAGNGSAGGS